MIQHEVMREAERDATSLFKKHWRDSMFKIMAKSLGMECDDLSVEWDEQGVAWVDCVKHKRRPNNTIAVAKR